MTTAIVAVIVTALIFDFVNGWNDSANAIATVVSTRVLSPMTAVVFAAILNFAGAFISVKVAKMIGGGLIDPTILREANAQYVILAAMIAAGGWVAVCTLWGMPISGSHSLIGGLVGAASAAFGFAVLKGAGILKVLIAMLASPLLGFVAGYILLVIV
ncbi:MAG: inorganic phosphate transporter, partial [Planctomycetota bacterium]